MILPKFTNEHMCWLFQLEMLGIFIITILCTVYNLQKQAINILHNIAIGYWQRAHSRQRYVTSIKFPKDYGVLMSSRFIFHMRILFLYTKTYATRICNKYTLAYIMSFAPCCIQQQGHSSSTSLVDLTQHVAFAHTLHIVHLTMDGCLYQNVHLG